MSEAKTVRSGEPWWLTPEEFGKLLAALSDAKTITEEGAILSRLAVFYEGITAAYSDSKRSLTRAVPGPRKEGA